MAVEGRTYRPVIDHAKCDACSVCLRACPGESMPEMRRENGTLRGEIYDDADTEVRININKALDLPPCQLDCPLHQDVRGYMKLIWEKRYREALELIRKTNSLPSVCGYICHRPCERSCIRVSVDEALSIRSLKRFVADYDDGNLKPPIGRERNGKKVAIVGSGPAGLTAAHELAKNGYEVDIVETYSEAGGMLAWAIPPFRLPREVLRRDIEYIQKAGVNIRTSVCLGLDLTISDLKKSGAQAIIIATGTTKGLKMNIENENDFEGNLDCLTFLKRYCNREEITIGNEVVVVGGGNAAVDSARSAVRLGARKTTILYRRGFAEMPADRNEVKEALIEGVNIEFLTAPVRVIASDGKIKGLGCVKTELREAPDSGKRRPVIITGTEFSLDADTIISAVGQEPDRTLKDTLAVDNETMLTSIDGVFAAGDFVNGPTTVVTAMASGKKAARAVDNYLSKCDSLVKSRHSGENRSPDKL